MSERDHRQRKTSFTAKRSWSPKNVPSWRSGKNKVTPGSSGVKVTRPTQQQKDEAEESRYLDSRGADAGNPFVTYKQQQEAREKSAYQASLKRQADMRRAIDMAYGTNRLSPEDQKAYDEETLKLLEAGVPDVGIGKRSIIDESPSTFHTLTDKQKQFLIDSGFAAAESSGVLGKFTKKRIRIKL